MQRFSGAGRSPSVTAVVTALHPDGTRLAVAQAEGIALIRLR